MDMSYGGVIVQNELESSLVVEVKEKQDGDPILLQLKGAVHHKRVEVFSQGGDDVLHYQGRLCVPNVGELRKQILTEVHNSRYSINPGATKMYCDLREVFWWNGLKRDITDFVAKCPNCQQVKVEHLKPGSVRFLHVCRSLILKRVGNVAYELKLPTELVVVHPVFHISLLKKCVGDPTSIVPLESGCEG
ncbi:hypothetical protein MTR67_012855 [Solanum verrucosum]|uniref:Integrase zinc-binding domain-containing protein n=1 Tax=Solanum verrucosum TaxID=315347 RepID=A0AAF0QDV4_SOLVR|nr:hypothetical protein MTR67_012855 [Solanum verrucosum]